MTTTRPRSLLTRSDAHIIDTTIWHYLNDLDRHDLLLPDCDFDPATDLEPLDAYIQKSPRYTAAWAKMRERHGLNTAGLLREMARYSFAYHHYAPKEDTPMTTPTTRTAREPRLC